MNRSGKARAKIIGLNPLRLGFQGTNGRPRFETGFRAGIPRLSALHSYAYPLVFAAVGAEPVPIVWPSPRCCTTCSSGWSSVGCQVNVGKA